MKSKLVSLLLTAAMITTSMPVYGSPGMTETSGEEEISVAEAGDVSEEDKTVDEEQSSESVPVTMESEKIYTPDLPESNELAEEYIQKQFYGTDLNISLFSTTAGDNLTGCNKALYDALISEIRKVAAGEQASTRFTLDTAAFWGAEGFTATDLGVDEINADNVSILSQEVFSDNLNMDLVIRALISDYPYELFWFDKTAGVTTSYSISYNSSTLRIKNISVIMNVSNSYRGESMESVNTGLLQSVHTAATSAQEIVQNAAGLSDLGKMESYRQTICDLTDYNDEAASDSYTGGYGDPWQLVYVFDGDPATKVVCEGYSKAFQYLMDQSSFSSEEINSYLVSGTMSDGPHMWNVVHMDDSKNYLVDVTNSDSLSIGSEIKRFMEVPDSGDVYNGYTYDTEEIEEDNGDSIAVYTIPSTTYVYDSLTLDLYSVDELTLSTDEYGADTPDMPEEPEFELSGSCGENATYELIEDENGLYELIIDGTGPMTDYGTEEGSTSPWSFANDKIKVIRINDGITTIGANAFRITCLHDIYVPESVTDLGRNNSYYINMVYYAGNRTSWNRINYAHYIEFTHTHMDKRVLSGECGYNTTYELVGDETNGYELIISGTDTIEKHLYSEAGLWDPFYDDLDVIKSIRIEEGITGIGSDIFHDLVNLTNISLPESLNSLAVGCIRGCEQLRDVYYAGDANRWYYLPIPDGNDSLVNAEIHYGKTSDDPNEIYDPEKTQWLGSNVKFTIEGEEESGYKLIIHGFGDTSSYYSHQGSWGSMANPPYSEYKDKIISLEVKEGITTIGNELFYDCTNLREVSLPMSLKLVNQYAFYGCSDLNVYYAGSIADWNNRVEIEKNNTALLEADMTYADDDYDPLSGQAGDNVFYKLYVNEDDTFELVIYGSGKMYSVESGNMRAYWKPYSDRIKALRIEEGITSIGDFLFENISCQEVIFPNSIESIGWGCFQGANIDNIVISEGITSISDFAFSGAHFKNVYLPSSLKHINNCAFMCSLNDIYYAGNEDDWNSISISSFNESLTSATMHYGVSFIVNELSGPCGTDANYKLMEDEDGLYELVISGTGSMNDYSDDGDDTPWAFVSDKIKTIRIEEGITSIGNGAFKGITCEYEVYMPETLTNISSSFSEETLKAIYYAGDRDSWYNIQNSENVDYTVTHMAKRLLSGRCGYEATYELIGDEENGYELVISGEGIVATNSYVNNRVLWYDDRDVIKSIRIEEGITRLYEEVFQDFKNLTTIYIPESLDTVFKDCFKDCEQLNDVYYAGDANRWYYLNIQSGNETFVNTDIHYEKISADPNELYDPEKTAWFGNNAKYTLEGDDESGYKLIIHGFGETYNYYTITWSWENMPSPPYSLYKDKIISVEVKEGITAIGDEIFYNCTNLRDVSLPQSLRIVHEYAFYRCSDLKVNFAGSMADWNNRVQIEEHNTALLEADLTCIDGSYDPFSAKIGDNAYYKMYGNGWGYELVIYGTGKIYSLDPDNKRAYWRPYNDQIRSLRIEEGITWIGAHDFDHISCDQVSLPSTLNYIDLGAFSGSSVSNVNYAGSKDDWKSVYISDFNDQIKYASMHYETDGTFNIPSGVCGEYAYYKLMKKEDGGYELVITGNGSLYDYIPETLPWNKYADEITSVILSDEITALGENTFYGCNNLTLSGKKGSLLETYAKEHDIPFILILNGWVKKNSEWYYYKDGEMVTNKWIGNYYLKADGTMAKDEWIGNYYVDESGAWVKDAPQVDRWVTNSAGQKWYRHADGSYTSNGWEKIDGFWYHFNASGYMQKGWLKLGTTWYYLGSDGIMQTGWQDINGKRYYLNASGSMKTGWLKYEEKWYYLTSSGAMAIGWLEIGTTKYYLDSDGIMQTGWLKYENKWYFLTGSGAMATGWLERGTTKYYLGADGIMRTGWVKIDEIWYYFKSSGAMVTGEYSINGKVSLFSETGEWLGYKAA